MGPRKGRIMTRNQILLVKSSFQALTPQRNRLAGIFFAQLFVREPAFRTVFRGNLKARGVELFDGLAAIVDALDRLYPIVPALEWLAVQAARRGVGERDYRAVGEAMLAAFRNGLGGAFTPELEQAWQAAIGRVAEVMAGALEAELLAA
jgi:hemoglobin-like flavoprotein